MLAYFQSRTLKIKGVAVTVIVRLAKAKIAHKDFWKSFIRKRLKKNYWVFLIKRRWWLKWALLACFILLALSGSSFYYYLYHYTDGFVDDMGRPLDFNKLANSDFKKTSYVYADDLTIIGRFFGEIRDPVMIKDVPVLALEWR